MILRSVVGKLWITIIILVSLVLIFLTLFLTAQVEKSYVADQQASMMKLSKDIQENLNIREKAADQKRYLANVSSIVDSFYTYMVVLDAKRNLSEIPERTEASYLAWNRLITNRDLKNIMLGETVVLKKRALDQLEIGNLDAKTSPLYKALTKDGILIIASPYYREGKFQGTIVLFQTLEPIAESHIKKWIFTSALIGIVLTSLLAFFLSSRITKPLIQIKKATEKMASGQYSTRVPFPTHEKDEIADLAITFNRMACQLEDSIRHISQEREQLSNILGSMSDGVVTLSKAEKVILINPHAKQLLAEQAERTPKNMEQFPVVFRTLFQKALTENRAGLEDVEFQGKTWKVVMSPLYAKSQVRGLVALLRDVSEERRVEKLRKDFVANVSHELRTPLSMLMGYSEALLDEIAETPETRREIVQVINEESQRMARLVDELLDLARMEAGQIHLQVQPVQLERFVQRVYRKFVTYAQEARTQLTVTCAENMVAEVSWDEDKVEQVLTNLLENAIRHTGEAGSVHLSVKQEAQEIVMKVTDTGAGIPEDEMPFIFERFYKIDKARTRSMNGGTGLGLSIVKHLVHLHGGKVSVSSQLGVGTKFIVRLPIKIS